MGANVELRDDPTRDDVEATLRQLDPALAGLIRQGSPDRLRSFAVACARLALEITGVREPLLSTALDVALTNLAGDLQRTNELAALRDAVGDLVERMDDRAFRVQEESEATGGPSARQDDYLQAFRAARAAASCLACLYISPLAAAAEATYEAFHTIDETQANEALRAIARREFGT